MLSLKRCHLAFRNIGTRTSRTLNQVKPVQDLESQLQSYPPEIRKVVLEKSHENAENVNTKEPASQPNLKDEEYNAEISRAYLMQIESFDELDKSFWQTARTSAREATANKSSKHLELFSMLFEAAKSIELSPQLRSQMLFEIGRYIYRQRKVRSDPVNEVEFLDALVAHDRAFEAVRLWEMRRDRAEVQDSPYWNEMGVLFYSDAGLISHANDLALKELQKLNGRVIAALVGAWSYQLRRKRYVSEAQHWIKHWADLFIDNIAHFNGQEIEQVLTILIHTRSWSLAERVAAKTNEIHPEAITYALRQSAPVSLSPSASEESHFLAFFEQISNSCGPALAADGTVAASLALSFAKQGDNETALDLLRDLDERNVCYPPVFHSTLAKALLSYYKQWPNSSSHSNSAILIGLRSSEWTAEIKQTMWNQYSELANPESETSVSYSSVPLIIEALRHQVLTPETTVTILSHTNSSQIWTQMWYLIAKRRSNIDARTASEIMSDTKYNVFNAQQLVYISQSIDRDSLLTILKAHASVTEPISDSFLAKLFVRAVRSETKKRRSIVRKPKFGPQVEPHPEISWKEVFDQINK